MFIRAIHFFLARNKGGGTGAYLCRVCQSVCGCAIRRFNPALNFLTPMSDQERASPYNIQRILSRQVMRIKKNND